MRQKNLLVIIVIICSLVMSGCSCNHEWENATCVEPKICTLCGTTDGEPLGHIPGDWKITNTIEQAKQCWVQRCSNCDKLLDTQMHDLDSFSVDSTFIFTPEEFMKRFEQIAKDDFPDFHYEIHPPEGDSGNNILYAFLYLGRGRVENYAISFYDADFNFFEMDDLQKGGVWSVSLEKVSEIQDESIGEMIDDNLAKVFYQTCDPMFTEDDSSMMQMIHLVTYMNWVDYGEYLGHHELNELLYEYAYAVLDMGDWYADYQAIIAYPDNWLEE